MKDSKVIFGVKGVASWLGFSVPTAYKFMRLGMPCDKIDNGTWVFHKENIDLWFKVQTAKTPNPKELEDEK